MTRPSPLVDVAWLMARLDAPGIRLIDARWHMPPSERDAHAEFLACHIPGAVHFDIDRVADPHTDLPHMLPDAAGFARAAGGMGIHAGDHVVVYDSTGMWTAPRVWWMFRCMGHGRASVLDGGLTGWRAAGGRVTDAPSRPAPATYDAHFETRRVRDCDAVRAVLASGREVVVDARAPGRFAGAEPEPRAGVRAGHMPGARNLHYAALVDPESGRLRPTDALAAAFRAAGVADDAHPIMTCGSGVTACILGLAWEMLGRADWSVYDGSWSEWGARADTPVVTGPAQLT